MTSMYTLDAAGEPQQEPNVVAWGTWMKEDDRRVVAKDTVDGEVEVSTVFLGIDHGFGDGPPVLWETMTFSEIQAFDGEQDRYTSHAEALAGHAAMVARMKQRLQGDQ